MLPLSADAIRMDCTDGLTSELPVKVHVEIPAFLYFQVGAAKAVAEVEFDVTPSLPAQGAYGGSALPPTAGVIAPVSITGSNVAGGVNVSLRANCGQVKLSYSVSDAQGLSNGAGYHIPYNTLQTVSDDAGLPAPVLDNAAANNALATTTAYGAVTDRSAVWKYSYNNATMPVSGVYQGTVTYQAACI